ncbi:MAG: hypothetical protein M1833_004454 [Piccolia ochrophora]|nr:MAG: hypothetical protein M1833_004454 [Piccolia ochrophora]
MTRAERFEDEKRRIIESCFGKKDDDGSLLESYITHLRIIEDAAHPSAPPPPDSAPNNKKPRLIVVAVRKSGRVRMHKARENANGSFSIGKTWALDDLTGIQSFSGALPTSGEDEQRRQWAGSNGFVVAIGKPYYWQAATAKEKEFFIGSLIKIFGKYTGGRIPELVGFDARETEQLLAGQAQPRQQRGQSSGPVDRPPPSQRPPSSGTSPSNRPEPRQRSSQDHVRAQREAMQRLEGNATREKSPGSSRTKFNDSSSLESSNLPAMKSPPSDYDTGGGRRNDSPRDFRGAPNRVVEQLGHSSSRAPSEDRRGSPTLKPSRSPEPDPSYANGGVPGTRRKPTPDLGHRDLDSKPHEEYWIPPPSVEAQRDHSRVPSRGDNNTPQEERPSTPGLHRRSGDKARIPRRPQRLSTDRSASATPELPDGVPSASEQAAKSTPPLTISTTPSVASPPLEPSADTRQDEDHRPGLGPMIKKKSNRDIAGAFRKAANAYNAFKPRSGGAGDQVKDPKEKVSSEPDGITGVIPAPSLRRDNGEDAGRNDVPERRLQGGVLEDKITEEVPQVKITRSTTTETAAEPSERPGSSPQEISRAASPAKQATKPPARSDARRQKRRSDQTLKCLSALDVDPTLLNNRALDFESVLSEFGWEGQGIRTINVDELQVEIRREIGRVEAGSWLGHLEQKDERVGAVEKMLDRAIAECDDLDGLLTLYSVELSTLNDDVAYIEAQSQGLQVQTANQKLLQSELQTLLQTVSISSKQLQSLRKATANLDSPTGLEAAENSLSVLYKAMVTIDPSLGRRTSTLKPRPREDGSISSTDIGGGISSEVGSMRALQEKKEGYRHETATFLQQLRRFMKQKFHDAALETAKSIERDREGALSRRTGKPRLDSRNHDSARRELWRYSLLMLFSREVDVGEWEAFIHSYEGPNKSVYQEEFRNNVHAWKRIARKTLGDEQEVLFTTQAKETEGIATTARKLTVKRSQTIAKTLRSDKAEGPATGRNSSDKPQDGKLHPYESFNGALDTMVPMMYTEQNFIVDYFHASSLEPVDFIDAVASALPAETRGSTDLRSRRLFDPDRVMARRVLDAMEEIYAFWQTDLQNLVDWAIKEDPLQGVGVLLGLERQMAELYETNQEFLIKTLQKAHDRLAGLFTRFLDEQIRAIDDTKVKIKRRKGVIAFMKTFPQFSTIIETMLSDSAANDLEVRTLVDTGYTRVNKAMFESLQAIAKETPAVMNSTAQGLPGQSGAGDPEDKEALNYHILLIENMNHYVEEVDPHGNAVLDEWRSRAAGEMAEHLGLYLNAVLRRPLGKMLDFLESTETLLQSSNTTSPSSAIATRPSHSRSTFKKLLSAHDAKELRRGIDALKKRVEKHFGDADDDPGLSRGLVVKVLRECEAQYLDVGERVRRVAAEVYEGGGAGLEWEGGREEVRAWFWGRGGAG